MHFILSRIVGMIALTAVVAVGSTVGKARATTVYTYTGGTFTTIFDVSPPAGTYDTNMRVSGSFTLSNPLAGNFFAPNIIGTVASFAFGDGRNTFTNLTPLDPSSYLSVSTNAAGNIVDWSFSLSSPVAVLRGEIFSDSFFLETDAGFLDSCTVISGRCVNPSSDSATFFGRGNWSVASVSAVPLPAPIFLLAIALWGFVVVGFWKKSNALRAKL